MSEFTFSRVLETVTDPTNLIVIIYMLIVTVFWLSARSLQKPEVIRQRALFFSPKYTIMLQRKFRSKFMDIFTSYTWFFVFIFAIFSLYFICIFLGKNMWKIGFSAVFTLNISMVIQLVFPVVVPIRYPDFNKKVEGFEIIRLNVSESSDVFNGFLYNGLPSNHLGLVITGMWLGWVSNSISPWTGWIVIMVVFFILAILFAFCVIYLGEHYPQDLIAAALVYLISLNLTYWFVSLL
ncbi:MAG: phosphatase PAP2 family protein [Candidatus Hodarchaeales archaeon]